MSEEIPELPRPDAPLRDGIGEEDHAIPGWFNLGFYGLIVVGLGYIFFYGAMQPYSQAEVYAAEVTEVEARLAEFAPEIPSVNPYRGDAAALADGTEVWNTICVACHLPDGRGLVGPSLIDPYWKYGDSDAELFETVNAGRPAGMPPWGAQLGAEKIWKVLAYMETLERKDEPGIGSPEYEAAKAKEAAGG